MSCITPPTQSEKPVDYTEDCLNSNLSPETEIIIEKLDIPRENKSDVDGQMISKQLNRRKTRPFQPILMCFWIILMLGSISLYGQLETTVKLGAAYTDNVFQLSEYDLQRYLDADPEMDFVNATDDVTSRLTLDGSYTLWYRWWEIQPKAQIALKNNILNEEKYTTDAVLGLRIQRKLGDISLSYGYYPHTYLRNYTDSDGTGLSEEFGYEKNQYKADLQLHPFVNSTFKAGYKLDEYYYNKYFTEFDGNTETWSVGYRHSFPIFYLSGEYEYKVFETDQQATQSNPEDSSYESNVYSFGIQIKKMPLDSKYPSVLWRPDLNLSYEEKFYQGTDSWHKGRTDKIYVTDTSLIFYFGDNWNLSLDYSHNFRNVDAVNLSVAKYKEFSENRFGFVAGYSF